MTNDFVDSDGTIIGDGDLPRGPRVFRSPPPLERRSSLDGELTNFVAGVCWATRYCRLNGVPEDVICRQLVDNAEEALFADDPRAYVEYYDGDDGERHVATAYPGLFRVALDADGFRRRDEAALERIVCLTRRVVEACLAEPLD